MRDLLDTGNLRISWRTYANPRWFFFIRYYIHNDNCQGLDSLLFLGPLQFRWWKQMNYTISRAAYFKGLEDYMEVVSSLPSNLQTLAPPFHRYLAVVSPKDPVRKPFQHGTDPLWIELTEAGYQRLERLSNPHAATLLAVWLVQHGK